MQKKYLRQILHLCLKKTKLIVVVTEQGNELRTVAFFALLIKTQ